jgi:hypothetical protein
MKVFISWSGTNSKKLGEVLRNWLPAVLQLIKPYFTPSDVEKGTNWNTEITKELESCGVGILCVTRDNLHSDWIMFEAGALSKSLEKAHVCPVLFGIHNTDLAGPLKQFQTTEFNKDDFRKLVSVINTKLKENKLPQKVLDSVFEKWWPELETQINEILDELGEAATEPIRSDRELIEEILELSRMSARTTPDEPASINPKALERLLSEYILIHNENVSSQGGYQDTLDHLSKMKKAMVYFTNRVNKMTPELKKLIDQMSILTFKVEKEEDTSSDVPF